MNIGLVYAFFDVSKTVLNIDTVREWNDTHLWKNDIVYLKNEHQRMQNDAMCWKNDAIRLNNEMQRKQNDTVNWKNEGEEEKNEAPIE